eukprot:CAMPEP_0182802602 /NCGR_PEP_ID=MMETSP0006_2-20121128/3567_1 /TAXON_ID=97485 /ORGANISM="Prymnesium parvum, Strain Texoma1" /LENGTH=78 /DNA_ID=CAMNT_0024927989 /DNA_START=162 /DNA_END=398 /DNA_ORIENTATION=+
MQLVSLFRARAKRLIHLHGHTRPRRISAKERERPRHVDDGRDGASVQRPVVVRERRSHAERALHALRPDLCDAQPGSR